MSPMYSDQWATVHHADAARIAELVPAKSVHTCVTSPPYFGLRSYLDVEDVQKAHEMGAEESPEEYVAALVEVFRGAWEVLRDDGTVWLNLGDNFLPGKQLAGMPWRVAFALQADGWILRSDIVWSKPNPMPESVADRPTKSHEYVFLLTKQPRYFYDSEAVREPLADESWGRMGRKQKLMDRAGAGTLGKQAKNGVDAQHGYAGLAMGRNGGTGYNPAGRNKRTVWTVTTRGYAGAHFATFPPALIEPCIKAGTSEYGVCGECGAPWERVVARGLYGQEPTGNPRKAYHDGVNSQSAIQRNGQNRAGWTRSNTTGWQPTCSHSADRVPATVLDPFAGSGTTMHTARRLGRRSVGLELDSRCASLIQERMGYQEVLL